MSFWTDLKRWWVGGSAGDGEDARFQQPTLRDAANPVIEDLHVVDHAGAALGPQAPAVKVLTEGPLTDLKRMTRYLASVGIESQLVMPPGGCGT